jgi:glyoxylase I family protein
LDGHCYRHWDQHRDTPASQRLRHGRHGSDTAFYEDLIGMPLVATWCEADVLFGKERVYCHCFFGLEDGSALAFFQFANPEDQALFGPKMAASPFHHIALNVEAAVQAQVEKRLRDAGYTEPQIYILEHGYCRSLYATDPNGMILELTTDEPSVADGAPARRASAKADLKRQPAPNPATHRLASTSAQSPPAPPPASDPPSFPSATDSDRTG